MSRFVPEVEQRFVGGLYLRKQALPAGERSVTHAHAVDHPTIVVQGTGNFWTGIQCMPYRAGDILAVQAGVNHHFEAHTDTVVWCVLTEDV